MTDRLDIARKIVEETCPHRRLKLENIQMFSEVIQCRKFHKGISSCQMERYVPVWHILRKGSSASIM